MFLLILANHSSNYHNGIKHKKILVKGNFIIYSTRSNFQPLLPIALLRLIPLTGLSLYLLSNLKKHKYTGILTNKKNIVFL